MNYIFDIDGTLMDINHRRHFVEGETKDWKSFIANIKYDIPNPPVADVMRNLTNYDKNIFKNFIKLTFATSFIYFFGMLWLGTLIGWEKPIFKLGAQPFLLAELFKILLITSAISKIRKIRDLV